VQAFLSKVTEPLPSEDEQRWFIETLHALDHTIGLAEAMQESAKIDASLGGPDERRTVTHYTDAMRSAAASSDLLEHVMVQRTVVAAEAGAKPVTGTLHAAPRNWPPCAPSIGARPLLGCFRQAYGKRCYGQCRCRTTARPAGAHAWRAATYLAGAVT
jgi:hypothetical protein